MTYEPTPAQLSKNAEIFTFHPVQDTQGERYEAIRAQAKNFANLLVTLCPDSRELSLAITHLQETVMFANASIAIHESKKES